MAKNITYQLQGNDGTSSVFYADLKAFTEVVLAFPNPLLLRLADEMHTRASATGKSRTTTEYYFELLMLGVFSRNYHAMAVTAALPTLCLLKWLYALRRSVRWLKPAADRLRGILLASLTPHGRKEEARTSFIKSSRRLVLFLEATGDYREEAARLAEWMPLLKEKDASRLSAIRNSVERFAEWFETEAEKALGQYTRHVPEFILANAPFYRQREDRLLCLRKSNEYHLNMVGAEIMNAALQSSYHATQKRVVLLPTCMRGVDDSLCRAVSSGLVRECTGCRPGCHIGDVKRTLRDVRHSVFLIPHSSDFSRFLRQWQGEPDTALIGVACVPNLIMGGYEMQSLGIPSQCVFLDYCGCRKHWSPAGGIATRLDFQRLQQIINR